MHFNIKITFKAIRFFERMTNISFLDIDNRPDLIYHLLYCCLLAHDENNFNMTFEEATKSFLIQNAEELLASFAKEMEIKNQFASQEGQKSEDDKSINNQEEASPRKEGNMLLSSLIPLLITDCGLDANFVLNDLDYTDTELYFKSSIEHKHDEMKDKRFWTFMQIAPHISSKSNIKEATDLVEFSWEKDERKKKAEEKMKRDRQKLIEVGIIKEDSSLNKEETE